jgi:hypothetical protein
MGDKKLVIYIPAKYHDEMRKSFEGKPMISTCKEAIPFLNPTHCPRCDNLMVQIHAGHLVCESCGRAITENDL